MQDKESLHCNSVSLALCSCCSSNDCSLCLCLGSGFPPATVSLLFWKRRTNTSGCYTSNPSPNIQRLHGHPTHMESRRDTHSRSCLNTGYPGMPKPPQLRDGCFYPQLSMPTAALQDSHSQPELGMHHGFQAWIFIPPLTL